MKICLFVWQSAAPSSYNYMVVLIMQGTRTSVKRLALVGVPVVAMVAKVQCYTTSVARELVRFSR